MFDLLERLKEFGGRQAACRLVEVQLARLDADVGVLVAVLEAGHTAATLGWVAHVEGLAVAALGALGVVVALGADVQVVGAGAVAVAIAVAQRGAVASHVAKVAPALVGPHTVALVAAFRAHGLAHGAPSTTTTTANGVALLADALKAVSSVHTLLPLSVARVVSIGAFVLRGPHKVVPVYFTSQRLEPLGHVSRQRVSVQEDGGWAAGAPRGSPVSPAHAEAPAVGSRGAQAAPAALGVPQAVGRLAPGVAGHPARTCTPAQHLAARGTLAPQPHVAGRHALHPGQKKRGRETLAARTPNTCSNGGQRLHIQ